MESVDALKRHAESGILQVHAPYGLGTFSRRLREAGEAARAAEIAHLLMQLLAKASTPSIQVHVLRGIANSGHPDALVAAKPLLSAPSTKVRAAAVDAIRLMPGDEVEQLIAAQLLGTDPEAQLAAVDAIAVPQWGYFACTLALRLSNALDRATRSGPSSRVIWWQEHGAGVRRGC